MKCSPVKQRTLLVSPIVTKINTIVNNKCYVPHATLKRKKEQKPLHSYVPYVEYELQCESLKAQRLFVAHYHRRKNNIKTDIK
jgi:hypothetical protein